MAAKVMDDFQNASATRIALGKLQPLRVLLVLAALSFSASVEQYLWPASRPAAQSLRAAGGRLG
jgi:hypothetical protein